MRTRWFRILMLWFLAVWFGAVVPGHTRGIVQLPGAPAGDTPSAMESGSTCCGSTKHDGEPKKRDCRGPCAVCFFAAALMHAPPVTFDVARLGLVGVLPLPCPVRFESNTPFRPYHSRAPPLV